MSGGLSLVLSVVTCVICKKDAFIRDTYQCDKYTHHILSCGCENVLAPCCNRPSSNVMYAEGEYFVTCDYCNDDDQVFDPPGAPLGYSVRRHKRRVSRKEREQNRAYSLDDKRKDHPRAYLKWTEDEKVAFDVLGKEGKTDAELNAIFLRQPHVSRLPDSERFVPDSASIYLLGEKISCGSCQHDTILTYLHVERVAKHLNVNVLDISKEMLLEVMKSSFKCTQCGSKAVTIEA